MTAARSTDTCSKDVPAAADDVLPRHAQLGGRFAQGQPKARLQLLQRDVRRLQAHSGVTYSPL